MLWYMYNVSTGSIDVLECPQNTKKTLIIKRTRLLKALSLITIQILFFCINKSYCITIFRFLEGEYSVFRFFIFINIFNSLTLNISLPVTPQSRHSRRSQVPSWMLFSTYFYYFSNKTIFQNIFVLSM